MNRFFFKFIWPFKTKKSFFQMIHQKETLKIGEFSRNTRKHKITFVFWTFYVCFFNFNLIFSWIIWWRLMKSAVCRKAFNADEWEESLRMHKLVNVRKGSVDRRKHQSSKVLSGFWFFEHYLSSEHSAEFSSFSHLFFKTIPKQTLKHLQAKQWHLHFQTLFFSLLL